MNFIRVMVGVGEAVSFWQILRSTQAFSFSDPGFGINLCFGVSQPRLTCNGPVGRFVEQPVEERVGDWWFHWMCWFC